jgi:hypothetical protein
MSTPKHTPGPWVVNTFIVNGQHKLEVLDATGANACIQANANLIAAAPAMYTAIQHLLEWAKGNRGSKTGNPYCIPEVRHALKTLASIQGVKDYLDADTTVEGGGL